MKKYTKLDECVVVTHQNLAKEWILQKAVFYGSEEEHKRLLNQFLAYVSSNARGIRIICDHPVRNVYNSITSPPLIARSTMGNTDANSHSELEVFNMLNTEYQLNNSVQKYFKTNVLHKGEGELCKTEGGEVCKERGEEHSNLPSSSSDQKNAQHRDAESMISQRYPKNKYGRRFQEA